MVSSSLPSSLFAAEAIENAIVCWQTCERKANPHTDHGARRTMIAIRCVPMAKVFSSGACRNVFVCCCRPHASLRATGAAVKRARRNRRSGKHRLSMKGSIAESPVTKHVSRMQLHQSLPFGRRKAPVARARLGHVCHNANAFGAGWPVHTNANANARGPQLNATSSMHGWIISIGNM